MPSLNALGLACLSDPRYLRVGWLPSTSELGITCLSNPHYLGLGWLPSPSAELGTLLSPESIWVWLAPNPACPGLGTLSSPHLRHDHSFKCAKEWLDLKGFLSLLKICLSVAPQVFMIYWYAKTCKNTWFLWRVCWIFIMWKKGWKQWMIYWKTYVEGHEGNHTSKIFLKGKRKTWGRSLYLEILLSG